jgi:hypothetical protein
MPTEHMSVDERRKYLKIMLARYHQADRAEQGRWLDEMQTVTALHRKSLLRLLHAESLERQPRLRQRGRTYDCRVDDALRVMAETLDYVCAERLTPALPWLAQSLAQHGELDLPPTLQAQLDTISPSTVRRRLATVGQDIPRLPRPRPSRGTGVGRTIPMRRIPWDEPVPGHFETDLVHHCGEAAVGDYVHTLQMVDVTTGWSERVAVFGRSQRAMEAGFRRIEARVPFPLLEIHPDNGGEFLNAHLLRYFHDAVQGAVVSRSRPYQKNDNRFVEQKNRTLVRDLFGDARFDTLAHQQLLDQLYEKLWLYYNFFQPVLRLKAKRNAVCEGIVRVYRQWDEAHTPLERLCVTGVVEAAVQARLRAVRDQTNPRQLRTEIYQLREQLFDLPIAQRREDRWLISAEETPFRSRQGRVVERVDNPSPGLPTLSTTPATATVRPSSKGEGALGNIII